MPDQYLYTAEIVAPRQLTETERNRLESVILAAARQALGPAVQVNFDEEVQDDLEEDDLDDPWPEEEGEDDDIDF